MASLYDQHFVRGAIYAREFVISQRYHVAIRPSSTKYILTEIFTEAVS